MFSDSYLKKCKALDIEPLTQDALVALCKKLPKYQEKSYLKLLSHFRIALQRMCCDSYLETQSLNDLWLIFYVQEKFQWGWVEGNSKWVPINKWSCKKIEFDKEK